MLNAWLQNPHKADTNAKENITFDKANLSGLNIKTAIDEHDIWKVKLNNALNGNSESPIHLTEVASDCKCALGKRLHGAGKTKFSQLPVYKKSVNAHANFHFSATEIIIEH